MKKTPTLFMLSVPAALAVACVFALPSVSPADTPDAYLDYVESSGTQYIDTGVVGADGLRMEAEMEWTALTAAGENQFCGATTVVDSRNVEYVPYLAYQAASHRMRYNKAGAASVQGGVNPVTGVRYHVVVSMDDGAQTRKFLASLNDAYNAGSLSFPNACRQLAHPLEWEAFRNSLYLKDWCPFIKQTFNGFGNAIEYLGRYTHKIAISNSRLLSVTGTEVSFSARAGKPGEPRRVIVLSHDEFIRRFLMHVLPSGFQKIRYYGFLNNRMKSANLRLIFRIQGHQRFQRRYTGLTMAELVLAVWKTDIRLCPECGCCRMYSAGRIRPATG